MCLINPTTKKPKMAKKNIVVWKFSGSTKAKTNFKARYYDYIYKPNNKQPNVNLEIRTSCFKDGFSYVKFGYHSYISLESAKYFAETVNAQVGKFIIPKNAKYYTDGDDEIVSETIIFKQFIGAESK